MEKENGGGVDGGKVSKLDGASMFTEDEVKDMSGFHIRDDHVIVLCGCTSHRFGDAVGTLRVYPSGELVISCECTPGCKEDKLTPAAFEKHSERETSRKWKNNIWVIINADKVPLAKTPLLKYYHKALISSKPNVGRVCHRDEFVRCSQCNKQRRFHLHTKEECRVYHDAFNNPNWNCSDMPYEKITCDDDEERASRRVYRGCFLSATCVGCTSCVCFGCKTCRFLDCGCQTCTDFIRMAKINGRPSDAPLSA